MALHRCSCMCPSAGGEGAGKRQGRDLLCRALPIARAVQSGATYGSVVSDGEGNQQWLLVAGCTLVEAAYEARDRCPESPQIQASFSRPHTVYRCCLSSQVRTCWVRWSSRGSIFLSSGRSSGVSCLVWSSIFLTTVAERAVGALRDWCACSIRRHERQATCVCGGHFLAGDVQRRELQVRGLFPAHGVQGPVKWRPLAECGGVSRRLPACLSSTEASRATPRATSWSGSSTP